jgi:uncharacterized protein
VEWKLSQYRVVTPPFIDETERRVTRVIYATRTAEVRIIDEASWRRLDAGRFSSLPERILAELVDIEFLVPEDEDELTTILNRNTAAAADDDHLYLVVQPTAACQLGCDYCGQHHTARLLSHEDQHLFVERTRRKLDAKHFRKLRVCWFGAEPLIGLSVIRSLSRSLKALAATYHCDYEGKVVTNGLSLTDRVADELVSELSVRSIEVTLDGVSDSHDARRHTKGGGATFDRIFSNVIALARRENLPVSISVRCNVDRRNCDGVTPLLKMLADAGVAQRITFYVAPIHSWGNDAHKLSFTPAEFAALEIDWLSQMVQLGFAPECIPPRKPIVCLAAMPDGELVDAYGSLFNCTEVSYVPLYGTPNRFSLGHLSTGEIAGRRNMLGDFNARVAQQEVPCWSCRMLPVCGGACPKLWQEGLEPCPSAKRNIEERLLLSYAASRMGSTTPGATIPDEAAVAS